VNETVLRGSARKQATRNVKISRDKETTDFRVSSAIVRAVAHDNDSVDERSKVHLRFFASSTPCISPDFFSTIFHRDVNSADEIVRCIVRVCSCVNLRRVTAERIDAA